MIYAAITLFALAALLGLAILIKWLTRKEASRAVVYSHGIVDKEQPDRLYDNW